jgi:hypothetical protein
MLKRIAAYILRKEIKTLQAAIYERVETDCLAALKSNVTYTLPDNRVGTYVTTAESMNGKPSILLKVDGYLIHITKKQFEKSLETLHDYSF